MTAAVPAPPSGPSTQRLAQFLKRRECIWMASPSLALLSVFIAGRARPTRLLVQEGSPPFVGHIGRVAGAVPEPAPLEAGEELRAALRAQGSSTDRAWGVATHRPGALVPKEWFADFEAQAVPTIELCLGGLFDLARSGPTAATFTIASLDDEPALDGAHLTALLTDDPAFAERVKQLCRAGADTDDYVVDSTPRGLAEDETALLTVIDRAITRAEAQWASAPEGARMPRPSRPLRLVWKRVFQASAPESPQTGATPPELPPLQAPRGQNSWLARLAELEQEQQRRLAEAEATIASRVEELNTVREEALRHTEEYRKDLAVREEQEVRLRKGLEALRLDLSERITTLEASVARGESQAAVLLKEKESLREAEALANDRYEALARKVEQLQEQHRSAAAQAGERERALRLQSREQVAALESAQRKSTEDVARLEGQIATIESDRAEVRNRIESTLAERDRDLAVHAVAVVEGETARLALAERAQELESARAEALASIARLKDQIAQLTSLSAAATVDREAAAARLLQLEAAHREELRLAHENVAGLRREKAEETARLNAVVAEWQTRFDTAALAAAKEAQRIETHHAAVVARLQDQVVQLREQAETASQKHSREAVSVAERISRLETDKAALGAERDDVLARLGKAEESAREAHAVAVLEGEKVRLALADKAQELESARAEASASIARLKDHTAQLTSLSAAATVEREAAAARLLQLGAAHREELRLAHENVASLRREKAEEKARLNAVVAEWQTRFATAALAAAKEAQRLSALLDQRTAEAERKRTAAVNERDQLEIRLGQSNQELREASSRSSERIATLGREKEDEVSRLTVALTAMQTSFEAATRSAAAEAKKRENEHLETAMRLQGDLADLRKQGQAAVTEHLHQVAALKEREAATEAEKADLAARLIDAAEVQAPARRVADERAAAWESERAEQARLLKATVKTWQEKLDAAAKAYAQESQAREARHTAALGTLVEAVQREKTAARAAEERTGELQKAAQEAQRQEAARAAMVVQLQEEVARLSMERASALAERVARLEQEKATRAIEQENLAAHLRQIEESHREAMRRAETRLDEAEARLRSTRARLAATREGWKKLSEGADRAAEGLKAALQSRALEGTAQAQAVSAWEAHRATIEARIAELERAIGPVSSARRPRRPLTVSAARVPEVNWPRVENPVSAPPGFDTSVAGGGVNLAASPTEAANGAAGRGPEGGRGEGSQQFVPWEYGRVVKGDLQEKRNVVQSFLKGVARRIHRK